MSLKGKLVTAAALASVMIGTEKVTAQEHTPNCATPQYLNKEGKDACKIIEKVKKVNQKTREKYNKCLESKMELEKAGQNVAQVNCSALLSEEKKDEKNTNAQMNTGEKSELQQMKQELEGIH